MTMERLQVTLGFVFIGLFICLVRSQQDTMFEDTFQSENSSNDAMTLLQNVSTIEAFVALLTKNGRQMTISDIYSVNDSETGKMVIEGGGRLAEPDDCSPRLTTVRLNFTNDSRVVHFPRCTKIERCGGCCSSANLECVPAYAERVSLKVVKAEMKTLGSSHMTYTGFSTVIVDRHVTCRVQCSLNEQKCGPLKTFLQNQCSCRCKEYRRCQSPHIWDPESCDCKCAVEQNCCLAGQPCALVLNPSTCECSVDGRTLIESRANLTDEQRAQYRASLNQGNTANSSSDSTDAETPNSDEETTHETTPATTTTTTTTTTNTITTEQSPCAGQRCPPHMVSVWNTNVNRCACRPIPRNRSQGSSRNP
ncbi:unnamed protein product [Lymnaea stagnalis]|uniref:Platelet-derived growth factor (PDGF) family profile domain-containing protein n=1 Tax=Lymnaea stagnalis TaxID=6523 RepID=A0AAV2IBG5_LYMST